MSQDVPVDHEDLDYVSLNKRQKIEDTNPLAPPNLDGLPDFDDNDNNSEDNQAIAETDREGFKIPDANFMRKTRSASHAYSSGPGILPSAPLPTMA